MPKKLFGDDTQKEDLEHNFGFSEEDIRRYTARLEMEKDQIRKDNLVQVSADVAADIQMMEGKDMQQVNLFGLPLDMYNRDAGRSSKDLQNAI